MTVPPEFAKAEPHARASGFCGTDRQRSLNIANPQRAFKGREGGVVGQFRYLFLWVALFLGFLQSGCASTVTTIVSWPSGGKVTSLFSQLLVVPQSIIFGCSGRGDSMTNGLSPTMVNGTPCKASHNASAALRTGSGAFGFTDTWIPVPKQLSVAR